jgi:hypothetical protein
MTARTTPLRKRIGKGMPGGRPRGQPHGTKHCSALAALPFRHIIANERELFRIAKESQINTFPQVGQWYARLDTSEAFLITGYDDKARTIETQAVDGDLDEIDADNWSLLPLAMVEAPQDWTEALADLDIPSARAGINQVERLLSA